MQWLWWLTVSQKVSQVMMVKGCFSRRKGDLYVNGFRRQLPQGRCCLDQRQWDNMSPLNDFLTHPRKKSEDSQGQGGEGFLLRQMFSRCRGESKWYICCRVHTNSMNCFYSSNGFFHLSVSKCFWKWSSSFIWNDHTDQEVLVQRPGTSRKPVGLKSLIWN